MYFELYTKLTKNKQNLNYPLVFFNLKLGIFLQNSLINRSLPKLLTFLNFKKTKKSNLNLKTFILKVFLNLKNNF